MNKGRIKKVLCTVLISTILLGFTACGKGKTAANGAGGWGEDNAALAKEFVYTERELELPEDLGNASVRQVTQSEETIYAVWEIYGKEETPESKFRLMSMKEDGSGIQFKNMQISSASETLDEHTYVGFTNFAFSGDKLFGIKEHYALADAELADGADATKVMLCCWNFEGDLIWEKNLESEGIDGSKADVWKLLSNANGGVSVVFGGSNVEIVVVTMEGELKERIALSTIDRTLSDLNDLFVGKDGTLLYTYVDEGKDSTMWLNVLNLSQGSIGDAKQMPDSFRAQGYRFIVAGEEQTDVVYTTTTGVYAIGKGEITECQWMNFINSNVPTTNMNHIILLDEKRFWYWQAIMYHTR